MRDTRVIGFLRIVLPLSIMFSLLLICTVAFAQAPPAGAPPPPPSPEEAAKIWALQAADVAKSIGLTPELSTKLSDAYKAARESYSAAMDALRGQGQEARRDFGKMRELGVAEKGKFGEVLKGFLDADQTAKVLATLGSFNRRWDSMVSALMGMGLDEASMSKAMGLVTGYVAESDKIMQGVTEGGDFQAVREKAQALREKLDTDMGTVLSPEQVTKWKEATAMRGRQPRLPGGAPAPGAIAPGAPAPAPKPAE